MTCHVLGIAGKRKKIKFLILILSACLKNLFFWESDFCYYIQYVHNIGFSSALTSSTQEIFLRVLLAAENSSCHTALFLSRCPFSRGKRDFPLLLKTSVRLTNFVSFSHFLPRRNYFCLLTSFKFLALFKGKMMSWDERPTGFCFDILLCFEL